MSVATEIWVSKSKVRSYLGIASDKLDGLIAAGAIGVRRLPGGSHARFNLADAGRLLTANTETCKPDSTADDPSEPDGR